VEEPAGEKNEWRRKDQRSSRLAGESCELSPIVSDAYSHSQACTPLWYISFPELCYTLTILIEQAIQLNDEQLRSEKRQERVPSAGWPISLEGLHTSA
jgi:hypothetical protein